MTNVFIEDEYIQKDLEGVHTQRADRVGDTGQRRLLQP